MTCNTIDAIVDAIRPLLNVRPNDKFESHGKPFLHSLIAAAMATQSPITFVLPAFPCKSPNAIAEVLGTLPDRGEEMALARLEAMCVAIEAVYPPGAVVRIFSDGRVFNKILGVATDVVLAYKAALLELAADCVHIEFDRLDNHTSSKDDPIEELKARYGVDVLDLDTHLAAHPGLCNTYRSFQTFLRQDLLHEFAVLDAEAKEAAVDAAAREMIRRNIAFSNLVADAYGSSIRLSIHAFDNAGPKFGVLLIPQLDGDVPTTPWHCVVCRNHDGTEFARKHEDVDRTKYAIVYKYGRPWCYEAKPELAPEWETMDVRFEAWRQGLIITANGAPPSLLDVPRAAVRAFATQYSLVVFRGFRQDDDFEAVAAHLGEILTWPTGSIFELKQDDLEGLASRSREGLPFHYDGMFKRIPGTQTLGDVPLYQLFQCHQPYPDPEDASNGRTLFVDTRRLLASLPATDVDRLRELAMTATTPANVMYGSAELTHETSLIVHHPVTGCEVLRFHEPWGADKTEGQPTTIAIVTKDGQRASPEDEAWVLDTLVPLLYDHRMCYSHKWRRGDFVLSDNVSQLHSRT
ncbi:hypothetical protein ACHHYP_06126, partial [Achlya hypogyna]